MIVVTVLLVACFAVAVLTAMLCLVCFRQLGLMYMGTKQTAVLHGIPEGSPFLFPPVALGDGRVTTLSEVASMGKSGFLCVVLSDKGCPVARDLLPTLEDLSEAWQGEVPVLSVTMCDSEADRVDEVADLGGAIGAFAFGSQPRRDADFSESPTIYILDPSGYVAARQLGGTAERISRHISASLNERWHLRLQDTDIANTTLVQEAANEGT